MKRVGKTTQSPRSESPALLNSFSRLAVEELSASASTPKSLVPSQCSGVLAEEKTPPNCQIQSLQEDKQPMSSMQLIDYSVSQKNANDVASEHISTTQEQQEMTMAQACSDSANGIASSCGSEDEASIFLGTFNFKKGRHAGGLSESDSSPKSGGSSRRGLMSSTPRLSLGSYSMPSLISINENHDAAFLGVNESVTSFVEFGNESTVSFLDNSSRTTSGLDTSSRTTTSSNGRAATLSYSSMPSLRSIQDNEDSQLLVYDANRSFGNSSSTESVFNSSQPKCSMMLPIMVEDDGPALFGVKVSYEGQLFAAESITKEIISPPSISKHLYSKNMEKRLHRWDAASAAVPFASLKSSSPGTTTINHGSALGIGGPSRAGHLRPSLSRTNATMSIMASLKNDGANVYSTNSELDAAIKVLRRPQAASQAALAVVSPSDGSITLPSVKSGSPSTAGDTRPAMVMRRPSVSADPSDSFASEGQEDDEDDEEEIRLR